MTETKHFHHKEDAHLLAIVEGAGKKGVLLKVWRTDKPHSTREEGERLMQVKIEKHNLYKYLKDYKEIDVDLLDHNDADEEFTLHIGGEG